MLKKKLTIKNKSGLHARPAALFVQIANKFNSDITIKKGREEVNGKSIMGIMTLAAERGSKISLRIEGEDAEDVLRELELFLEKSD
ncbi:MAG: HPr family phosphocarrier protein [Candidatus Omnitrophica bacterium]|nr:HPr family phosphocarrier protein [Candidatus Omnitrophota bacterium]